MDQLLAFKRALNGYVEGPVRYSAAMNGTSTDVNSPIRLIPPSIETGIVYLLGGRAAVPYRLLWLVFIYLGATGSLQVVWGIADTLNGLMALPNLIAVLGLIPVPMRLHRGFWATAGSKRSAPISTRARVAAIT